MRANRAEDLSPVATNNPPWGCGDNFVDTKNDNVGRRGNGRIRTAPGQQLAPPATPSPGPSPRPLMLSRSKPLLASDAAARAAKEAAAQTEARKQQAAAERRPQTARDSQRTSLATESESASSLHTSRSARGITTKQLQDSWASCYQSKVGAAPSCDKKTHFQTNIENSSDENRWVSTTKLAHADASGSYCGWQSPQGVAKDLPSNKLKCAGLKSNSSFCAASHRPVKSIRILPEGDLGVEPRFHGQPDESGLCYAGKTCHALNERRRSPATGGNMRPKDPDPDAAGVFRRTLEKRDLMQKSCCKPSAADCVNLRNAPSAYHEKWAKANSIKLREEGVRAASASPDLLSARRASQEIYVKPWVSMDKTIPEKAISPISRLGLGQFKPSFTDPLTSRHLPEEHRRLDDQTICGKRRKRPKQYCPGWKTTEGNKEDLFVHRDSIAPQEVQDLEMVTLQKAGSPRNADRRRKPDERKSSFFKCKATPHPSTLGRMGGTAGRGRKKT